MLLHARGLGRGVWPHETLEERAWSQQHLAEHLAQIHDRHRPRADCGAQERAGTHGRQLVCIACQSSKGAHGHENHVMGACIGDLMGLLAPEGLIAEGVWER